MAEAGNELTDEQFMTHILRQFPEDYDKTVDEMLESMDLDPSDDECLTITMMYEKLARRYQHLKTMRRFKGRGSAGEDGEDVGPFTGGGFKGKCNYCGKHGHKSADCRVKKQDQGGSNNTKQKQEKK